MFASEVAKALKDTDNMQKLNGTNVRWFRLREYPSISFEQATDARGESRWRVTLPCEMVFSTTTTYD